MNILSLQGKALRNLSESTGIKDSPKFTSRIVATVLPFTDECVDTNKDTNDGERNEFKKQLKNAECLQESGIFEEAEYNSQGTQTDSISVEPLTGEFKLPFETGVVGDLCAEIQKLNKFRERVEEAGNCCSNKTLLHVGEVQGDQPPPHTKELEYCRERLQLLEDKVSQIYLHKCQFKKCRLKVECQFYTGLIPWFKKALVFIKGREFLDQFSIYQILKNDNFMRGGQMFTICSASISFHQYNMYFPSKKGC